MGKSFNIGMVLIYEGFLGVIVLVVDEYEISSCG